MLIFLHLRCVLAAMLAVGTLGFSAAQLHASGFEHQSREVALVFQAGEGLSPSVLAELKAETNRILKRARVSLKFTTRQEAAMNAYNDLLFFRVKGQCEMDAADQILDERGPLAWSFTEDGRVMPFGEVECTRVKQSIRTVMHGGDFARANKLLGRALGRVVAHEIFHMLTGTKHHSDEGVFREALSARQLIAERLDFTDDDYKALQSSPDFTR